ncbi:MAG: hypothetical protein M3O30_12010, partial [Planctomycetota bacterium]|nr:hypothetical protein [Planctomycetota bacterium]
NAKAALTPWLFGGDGLYDPSTGWTYQLARYRNGFWFTQMDSYGGDSADPQSLHKYLYVGANSVNNWDPSGHDLVETLIVATLIGGIGGGIVGGIAGGVRGAVYGALSGAVLAPAFTAGVVGGGIATSATLLYFGLVFSPQVASFVIGTALTAYSTYRIGHHFDEIDLNDPNASRQIAAGDTELAFTMIGWAVGAAALGRSQYLQDVEAAPLRQVYREAAADAAQVGNANPGASGAQLESMARQAYQIRSTARLQVRGMMSQWINLRVLQARDLVQYGDADGPSFDFLVQKAKAIGYSGDDIYRYIISGSARTSAAVDSAFKPKGS